MKWAWLVACVIVLCSSACDGAAGPTVLSRAELLDPETCKDCHSDHYNEWSGSMHAYASRDPVFQAMNKRGQEEADLGDFCVKCHAPMAVIEKAIPDFKDLTDIPDHLQGVTCYFCHTAEGVGEPHNNARIKLAKDNIMRGSLGDPIDPGVHGVLQGKSPFHDRKDRRSSTLCGTCHDIVLPNGTHFERTLLEYEQSIFVSPNPQVFQSCQSCHMRGSKRLVPAAPGFDGSLARTTHSHLWPAVDIALTDFPNQPALRSAIERCEFQLRTISYFDVQQSTSWVPNSPYAFEVLFEANTAHKMPSGAANDRRMWLEVIAYDGDVERWRSGVIADGELEDKPKDDPARDAQLCLLRSRFKTETGEDAHMFWDAVGEPEESLVPITTTLTPGGHTKSCIYVIPNMPWAPPTKLHLRLRVRPMGMDVLDDLIQSGHLDASVKAKIPTFTVFEKEATFDPQTRKWVFRDLTDPDCNEFVCLLNPRSPGCPN